MIKITERLPWPDCIGTPTPFRWLPQPLGISTLRQFGGHVFYQWVSEVKVVDRSHNSQPQGAPQQLLPLHRRPWRCPEPAHRTAQHQNVPLGKRGGTEPQVPQMPSMPPVAVCRVTNWLSAYAGGERSSPPRGWARAIRIYRSELNRVSFVGVDTVR